MGASMSSVIVPPGMEIGVSAMIEIAPGAKEAAGRFRFQPINPRQSEPPCLTNQECREVGARTVLRETPSCASQFAEAFLRYLPQWHRAFLKCSKIKLCYSVTVAGGYCPTRNAKHFWRGECKGNKETGACDLAGSRATPRADLQCTKKPVKSSFRADVQLCRRYFSPRARLSDKAGKPPSA